MPEKNISRLPTVRLRDDDDDIREWVEGLDNKSGTIRKALRHYIAAGNGQTQPDQHEDEDGLGVVGDADNDLEVGNGQPQETDQHEQGTTGAADDDTLAAGEAWIFDLIKDRKPEMATPSVDALASSDLFKDIARALGPIERFFDSRNSYNEMMLSTLYQACHQILHRIAERRRELAPEDRRRMQELAEKDIPYLTLPDTAVELVKRAEALYDQKLDHETRCHLIETIRSSFSQQDQ